MGTDTAVTTRKRPASIWLVSLGNGLLAAFLIATSLLAVGRGYSVSQAVFTGIIGLGVSISAHAVWYGYRYGRIALLALITLFAGLIAVQDLRVVLWAMDVGYRGPIFDWAIVRVVLSLAWLSVNYWLLLGKRARVFFS